MQRNQNLAALDTQSAPSNSLRMPSHSPLTLAAAAGKIDSARKMLPGLTQEDINWRGVFGNTALHWSIANTNIEMALFLMDNTRGLLNFEIRDHRQKTALHLAIGKGWYHFNTNDNCNPHSPPQAPVIERLIASTPLDAQDNCGNTPLHIAMLRRDINCIELLLKNHASLTIRNQKGQTPEDMLNLEFEKAEKFLQSYVLIYTLSKEIWEKNKEAITKLLSPARAASDPEEEKEDLTSSLAARITCDYSYQLEEQYELAASAEIIFEQAILYSDSFVSSIPPLPKELLPAKDFSAEIQKLKTESQKLAPQTAKALALAVLELARRVGSLSVDHEAIAAFHEKTKHLQKSAIVGKIIGTLIGAAIGLCLGIAIGMAAGPAGLLVGGLAGSYKGALMGAAIGSFLGSGLGFWFTKKTLEQKVSLKGLEAAASEEVNRLQNPIM